MWDIRNIEGRYRQGIDIFNGILFMFFFHLTLKRDFVIIMKFRMIHCQRNQWIMENIQMKSIDFKKHDDGVFITLFWFEKRKKKSFEHMVIMRNIIRVAAIKMDLYYLHFYFCNSKFVHLSIYSVVLIKKV